MEENLIEELVPDKVHAVNDQGKSHHDGGAEDGAKADHQQVSTHDVDLQNELVLDIKAKQEVAENAYQGEHEQEVRDCL